MSAQKTQTASMNWGRGGHHLLERIPLTFLEIEILVLGAWACWLIKRGLQTSTFYLFSNNCLFPNSLSNIKKEVNSH